MRNSKKEDTSGSDLTTESVPLGNAEEISSNNIISQDNDIVNDSVCTDVKDVYNGDANAVLEEFVADVMSGMNDYTADYIDIVTDYWYDGKDIDKYNPAEYNKLIDTGSPDGNNDRLSVRKPESDARRNLVENSGTDTSVSQTFKSAGTNADISELMSLGNDGFIDLDFDFAVRKVKMNVFPPYNESKSDANEQATRWAHKNEVRTGSQKLISYHSHWYVIEKFDSSDLQYQIIGAVSTKEVNRFINEVKNRENGFKQAKQRILDGLDDSVEIGGPVGLRRYRVDHDANQHGRKFEPIQELDKNQNEQRLLSNNTRGNIKQDGKNRQNKGGIEISERTEVSDNEGNIIIKKDDVSFKSKSEATNDSSSLGETSPVNSISKDNDIVNDSVCTGVKDVYNGDVNTVLEEFAAEDHISPTTKNAGLTDNEYDNVNSAFRQGELVNAFKHDLTGY